MFEIKNDKSELLAKQISSKELKLSVTENGILERRILLNKKQVTDLINYLIGRQKEMKS